MDKNNLKNNRGLNNNFEKKGAGKHANQANQVHASHANANHANAGHAHASHLHANHASHLHEDHAHVYANAGASKSRAASPKSRTLDTKAVTIPFEHGEWTITRRQLMYVAGGVVALGVVGGGAYAFNQVFGEHEVVESSINVNANSVVPSTSFQQIEQDKCVNLVGDFKLSFGTMLWCNDEHIAACLVPTDTGNPLTKVDLLHFSTGNTDTVLEAAAGASEGFQILDVRATSSGIIWVESDILEQTWRVYTAVIKSDGSLGSPVCIDSGDEDWELPSIAVVENMAFWQVQPSTSGAAAKSATALKSATLGGSSVKVLWESSGHSACGVCATDKYVVIAPRAQTGSSVRYRLTCLDAKSGKEVDSLVLPSTMKPTNIGYCDTGFSFAFDAIYSNATGISNIGTYVPTSKVSSGAGYSANSNTSGVNESGGGAGDGVDGGVSDGAGGAADGTGDDSSATNTSNSDAYSNANWFRWARTPVCAPANCGNFLVVKSTSAVCGVNLAANTYFAIDTTTGCEDYGDMLASSGSHKNFVTYSNITTKPLSGESEQYCHVRVWESL